MSEMIVLLVPLLGTTLGAAMVFLMRNEMNARLEKALLGFAAGVMIAASVWSLLIPPIDCFLYSFDAAHAEDSVELCGRRIIEKKINRQ